MSNGISDDKTEVLVGIASKKQIEELKKEYENGYLNEEGLKLYSQTEIKERNETFEVQEYLKDFILIGDDSGGLGFLMDKDGKVYSCDLGFLDEDDMELKASSLEEFLCLVS